MEDHSPRCGIPGEHRVKQATGGGAQGAGESSAMMGNVRGNIGREARRGFEPSSQCTSTPSAAAPGGPLSSARTPRPFAASLEARGGGNDSGTAGKEETSPRRSSFSPNRQRYRNVDSNNSSTGTRRKSSGLDQTQPQAPLSSFDRGDGVQGMSRNMTRGRGGGAYGRTASTQRDRQTIGNTGFRRASTPSRRVAGSFAQGGISPAGKRLANAAASLNAAAEASPARGRTTLDAWEEMAAAGEVNAGRRGWTFGGRTQGDYLLQQRARGGGKQVSRR